MRKPKTFRLYKTINHKNILLNKALFTYYYVSGCNNNGYLCNHFQVMNEHNSIITNTNEK